ncbi:MULTISPECIES: hypothetical protein [unclassified Chryseobacterium]|uniref:hypothetical protein n=1 Tax=unclassified Chryseobacterium TaxID=2593645 RepID=UPI00100B6A18|nr:MULTISPECIES: hypothetical protein [unclassified Chryseobacterium]
MDSAFYLNEFRLAAGEIPKEKLDKDHLNLSIDTVLESVALKMYKSEWYGDAELPKEASGRIFFSIWVNEKTIEEGRIYYNIHALKLRELKRYKIASKDFAKNFRNEFLKHQKEWPNVSVNFGPLTLMEGWIELKNDFIQEDVYNLAQKFLKINSIIDKVLEKYKKQ